MHMHRLVIPVLFVMFASTAAAAQYDAAVARQAWVTVSQVEKAHGIPRGLLHSMSLVETGQGLEGEVLPWPYTVGVNPTRSYKFEVGQAALAQLETLRRIGFKRFDVTVGNKRYKKVTAQTAKSKLSASTSPVQLKGRHFSKRFQSSVGASTFVQTTLRYGYKNLDLGLMQINWRYHSKGFNSVEEAFDPAKNAEYAVSYLQKHKEERDWWNSVGRYHSGTPVHANRYIQSVYAMYKRVRRIKDRA